jgi:hypothetical protein
VIYELFLNFKNKVQIGFSLVKWVICFIKYPSPFSRSCRFEIVQNLAFFNQKESNRNKIEKEKKEKRKRKEKAAGRRSSLGQETAHNPLTLPH